MATALHKFIYDAFVAPWYAIRARSRLYIHQSCVWMIKRFSFVLMRNPSEHHCTLQCTDTQKKCNWQRKSDSAYIRYCEHCILSHRPSFLVCNAPIASTWEYFRQQYFVRNSTSKMVIIFDTGAGAKSIFPGLSALPMICVRSRPSLVLYTLKLRALSKAYRSVMIVKQFIMPFHPRIRNSHLNYFGMAWGIVINLDTGAGAKKNLSRDICPPYNLRALSLLSRASYA